jgi:hypothetical protein
LFDESWWRTRWLNAQRRFDAAAEVLNRDNRRRVPVVAIDAANGRGSGTRGERIGIVATAPTTLEPSGRLIEVAAAAVGRHVVVRPRLVADAVSAFLSGDAVGYDRMVLTAVDEEAACAEVVVLAQASMARVLTAREPHPIGARSSRVQSPRRARSGGSCG